MSLILEALKKSERQRQVGTAPTLATPAMTRRARRSPLPWLLVAIVVAAAAGWWLSRDAGDSAPPAVIADAPSEPAGTISAAAPPVAEAPMTTVQPPASVIAPPAAPPQPVAAAPAPANAEQKTAELSKAIADAAPLAGNTTKQREDVAQTAPTPAAVTPRTSPTPTGPIATPPAPTPAAPPPAAPPAAVAAPSRSAGLPLLWELPYSKRKDIPSLSMSLQVYSDEPTSRFAIINDERRKEGDTIGSDLVLQEITPEGLILEFHGERFLYPRGGR